MTINYIWNNRNQWAGLGLTI